MHRWFFYFNFSQKSLILDLTISRFSRLIFPWEISRLQISRFPVSREKLRCLISLQGGGGVVGWEKSSTIRNSNMRWGLYNSLYIIYLTVLFEFELWTSIFFPNRLIKCRILIPIFTKYISIRELKLQEYILTFGLH